MRVKDPFLATLLDLGTASGLPMNLLSVSGASICAEELLWESGLQEWPTFFQYVQSLRSVAHP